MSNRLDRLESPIRANLTISPSPRTGTMCPAPDAMRSLAKRSLSRMMSAWNSLISGHVERLGGANTGLGSSKASNLLPFKTAPLHRLFGLEITAAQMSGLSWTKGMPRSPQKASARFRIGAADGCLGSKLHKASKRSSRTADPLVRQRGPRVRGIHRTGQPTREEQARWHKLDWTSSDRR
jgi:hypothetical protein